MVLCVWVCVYMYICLFLLASYFLFFVFISFILLLPSCVFILPRVSFAFGPSLLYYLFWGFPSSSPSFLSPYSSFFPFLSSSSLCLHFLCLSSCFLVSCSFLLPPAALSFFISVASTPFLPPSLLCSSSSFFSFLLLFFSSLLLFLPYIRFLFSLLFLSSCFLFVSTSPLCAVAVS